MKIILSSKRHHYVARVSIFLVVVALIAGMVGCGDGDGDGDGYTPQGKGWQPIGTEEYPFTGTFDGQGHEIRDLFINRPDECSVGLFGLVDEGGRIEDIGVVNATVTGGDFVGGLVGYNQDSTVSNCYATGNVIGVTEVGGLVGENAGNVSNSYSTGSVAGTADVGGLAGENDGNVSNSYSTGNVTGNSRVGGLVGQNHAGTVCNSYSTGSVAGTADVGGLAGRRQDEEESTVTNSFWDTETSGQATSYGGTGKTTAEMQDITTFSGAGWDIIAVAPGSTNTTYIWNIVDEEIYPFLAWMVGCGPPSQNLEIRDWYDLDAIRDNPNGNYTLMNDLDSTTAGYEELASPTTNPPSQNLEIRDWYDLDAIRDNLSGNHTLMNDLASTTAGYTELASLTANGGNGWQPIGTEEYPFTGTFDGQGHEIRDLFINRPDERNNGLFGKTYEGGVIEDIGVVNVTVIGDEHVGGLVAWNQGTTVSNCYSTGDVSGDDDVGGLVGWNYDSTVSNSYSTCSVTGNTDVGGLVGDNGGGTVRDSYSSGKVTGNGGLVGYGEGIVSNSFWDTETSGQATSDGGIGKTTAEMQDITTFSGATWDIVAVANPTIRNLSYIWNIVDNETYPFLSWEPVS